MNNNFLGIRGLYKTHMDGLKPFNSKSVTYTYIGYTEHNSRGQPIVGRLLFLLSQRRPGKLFTKGKTENGQSKAGSRVFFQKEDKTKLKFGRIRNLQKSATSRISEIFPH